MVRQVSILLQKTMHRSTGFFSNSASRASALRLNPVSALTCQNKRTSHFWQKGEGAGKLQGTTCVLSTSCCQLFGPVPIYI